MPYEKKSFQPGSIWNELAWLQALHECLITTPHLKGLAMFSKQVSKHLEENDVLTCSHMSSSSLAADCPQSKPLLITSG